MAAERLVFTGGGTAGHVLPVVPLISHFHALGWEVHFIGSRSGLESRLLADAPVRCHQITCGKLRRYLSFRNLVDAFRVPIGVLQAVHILTRVRPRLVFSKGGYVSFPVVMAAWLLRIPIIVHESDRSAGLANRLAFPFARLICTNFEHTPIKTNREVHWTGIPLRQSLLTGSREAGRRYCQMPEGKPLLLVVGGSLGSSGLNRAVRGALPKLTRIAQVVHVCGPGQVEECLRNIEGYRQFAYLDEPWGDVLAAADLVVSRAGATILSELLALAKPSLLVPLGTSASRGEQIDNARHVERQGFVCVLPEERLDGATLVHEVTRMLADLDGWRSRLAEYRPPDAVERIGTLIKRLAR